MRSWHGDREILRALALSLWDWTIRAISRLPSASTLGMALRWSLSQILAATAVLVVCWLVFVSPWAMPIWWGFRPWTLRS